MFIVSLHRHLNYGLLRLSLRNALRLLFFGYKTFAAAKVRIFLIYANKSRFFPTGTKDETLLFVFFIRIKRQFLY